MLPLLPCSGVTGYTQFDIKEQTDDGTTYRFQCPPGCATIAIHASETPTPPYNSTVFGVDIYADISYICAAAAHAGIIDDSGGLLLVRVEEGQGPNADNSTDNNVGYPGNVTRNGITSVGLPNGWDRSFSVHEYPVELVEVRSSRHV